VATELTGIQILSADLDRASAVFSTIIGTEAKRSSGQVRVRTEAATLTFHDHLPTDSATGAVERPGIFGLDLTTDDLASRVAALGRLGLSVVVEARDGDGDGDGDGRIVLAAGGISVQVTARTTAESESDSDAGIVDPSRVDWSAGEHFESSAKLDHVALAARDLGRASALWAAITGVEAEQMGLHPVSGGAFSAARVHLGEAMIELVSPTPGHDSPLAKRLAANGEGPVALALPVANLDTTLARLNALGVRVDRRDPHWMVHPRDSSGVLVQLTPRVEH